MNAPLPGRRRPRRPARPSLDVEALDRRTMLSNVPGASPGAAEVLPLAAAEVTPGSTPSPDERFVTRIAATLADGPLPDRLQALLVRRLDAGASRERIAAFVMRTPAGHRAEVRSVYHALLDRTPTPAEVRQHLRDYARGADQLAVIRRVAASPEYFQARGGGNDAGFVDAIATDLLRRPPTAAESARWLGLLDRGASRGRVVTDLLRSPAYIQAASAQIATHGSPGVGDPALVADVASALRGPGGLTRAKAVAFGSDAYLNQLLAPPTPRPLPPAVGSPIVPPNPGYPFTPSYSLETNWNPISPAGVGFFNIQAIGASPQGAYWISTTDSGVAVFDAVTGATTPSWGGYAASISPISDTTAWIVGSDARFQGPVYLGTIDAQGTLTKVADLPGGDTPTQVSASPDGTVWAMGQSGAVYSYDAGGDSWSTVPSGGFQIAQISVGSASNILAVEQGGTQGLVWTPSGWAVDSGLSGANGLQVAATSDGAAWAYADGFVFLRPPGGTWAIVPNQTPPGTLFSIAANDRNRMVTILDSANPLQILSYGVLDRPATPFPEVTSQWAAGYAAINAGLHLAPGVEIRNLYGDAIATLNGYLDTLTSTKPGVEIPRPSDVTPDNWEAITDQIITELNDVIAVNTLYTTLTGLNTDIGQVNTDRLGAASTLVRLTQTEQQNDTLQLAVVGMFEAALAGLAASFSGGAAIAAAAFASGIDNLVADLTGQKNPPPDTKLAETYATLSTDLANIFTTNLTNYGTQQAKIVADYGMLTAIGGAVYSGLWTWSDTSTPDVVKATTAAFDLFFYQALIPAKWQIVYDQDYICDAYTCPTFNAPDVDTYVVVVRNDAPQAVVEDVWFVNELGGPTNPFSDAGPYPDPNLLPAVWALGVAQSDFFNSQAGWTLKTVNAT